MRLSASKVDLYNNCPRKYYYQYITKPIKFIDTQPLVFGNIVHKLLEEFHKNYLQYKDKKYCIIEALKIVVKDSYLRDNLKLKIISKKDIEAIKHIALAYLTKYSDINNVYVLEKSFEVKINDITISGRIDRVDKSDSFIKVVDYKTSRNIYTKEEITDSIQLPTYVLWAKQEFGNDIKIFSEYIFVKHLFNNKGVVHYNVNNEVLDNCIKTYESVAQNIENKKFDKNKKFKWCGKWCQYEKFCRGE